MRHQKHTLVLGHLHRVLDDNVVVLDYLQYVVDTTVLRFPSIILEFNQNFAMFTKYSVILITSK